MGKPKEYEEAGVRMRVTSRELPSTGKLFGVVSSNNFSIFTEENRTELWSVPGMGFFIHPIAEEWVRPWGSGWEDEGDVVHMFALGLDLVQRGVLSDMGSGWVPRTDEDFIKLWEAIKSRLEGKLPGFELSLEK